MSVQVKRRRDTAANIAAFTPAQGELIVDTTNNRVIVGDGQTAGGWPAAKLSEVVTVSRTAVSDANYTVLPTDRLIAYAAITAARTVTLPPAASYPVGVILWIADQSGACSTTNTITISRAGSDTIDGGASALLNAAYDATALTSDGVSRWTIMLNPPNQQLSLVGIGTAPDPNNPLTVYGGTNGAALFNGSNFSFTVNKAAAANVASIIFEDNFSLRVQIGLLNDDNFTFKVSPNGSSYFTGLTLDSGTGAVTLGNARTAVSNANYAALATDREIAYTAIAAARTVTLPPASAFPAGHDLLIVDESGSVSSTNTLTVSPAGSDTINGSTAGVVIAGPYGYCRLRSNGSNKWSQVGRRAHPIVFASSGIYTPTPGMTKCDVYLLGGGGGGGGGALQAASAAVSGGGGGGGAALVAATFSAAAVGSSQAIAIGAGGAAGAAATTASTAGGNGGAGGNTSFGALLVAYGGGGGAGGQLAAASGGGGGGGAFGGGASATGSTGGAGGVLGGGAGGSGAAPSATAGLAAGGGGGGGAASGASSTSNIVAFGGGGGGSGAGITSGNATASGGNSSNAGVLGTGVAGGAPGASGSPGVNPNVNGRDFNRFAGSGGGGGGSSLTAAGAGGNGGLGGGGGGGGSAQNGGMAGAGGAGGAGYAIIVEHF
jgi:hypothetical protein